MCHNGGVLLFLDTQQSCYMDALAKPFISVGQRDDSGILPALQKLLQLAYSEDSDKQLEVGMFCCADIFIVLSYSRYIPILALHTVLVWRDAVFTVVEYNGICARLLAASACASQVKSSTLIAFIPAMMRQCGSFKRVSKNGAFFVLPVDLP